MITSFYNVKRFWTIGNQRSINIVLLLLLLLLLLRTMGSA